jgi:indole-3-glycerol phosphate synthase
MSDILKKIVAVKHEEIALSLRKKSFEAVRADAESRVLTRDFVGAIRQKLTSNKRPSLPKLKRPVLPKGCYATTSCLLTLRKVMLNMAPHVCRS